MLRARFREIQEKYIVLASGSPRRKELLTSIGLSIDAVPSTFSETLRKDVFPSPADYVEENACRKALDVTISLRENGRIPHLIIGSDTVVVSDGVILEKPKDREHAIEMLSKLSGCKHHVVTAVAFALPERISGMETLREHIEGEGLDCRFQSGFIVFHEKTEVTFGEIPRDVIEAYVDTGEPMDKAGGYGIQGLAGTFVSGIDGCYYNVVGFPLHHFCKRLLSLLEEGIV